MAQTLIKTSQIDFGEINRTWTADLIFDEKEISYATKTMDSNIAFTLGSGSLVDSFSAARQTIIADGVSSVSFASEFNFLYGIANGQVLDAGTYEFYFLFLNGSVSVNVPGVTAETSGANTLAVPANFAAVADGENDIDLSWDDVSNEDSYLIQVSETGTGGWSTLSTPAADATTSTQTGLNPGDTRFYRIKAIGDGVNFLDSAFSGVISGQTESSGDVTAPTFTFLPASGVTTWTINRPITITANEPIRNTDGSEITSANVATRITLKETDSSGTDITFTATIDGTKTVITITPTTQYGENQLVYVAINNVEDVNGNEVTVAESSTFTTTEYTFFDGTSNRLIFGDILDSLFAANDTVFKLKITINNATLAGTRILIGKYSSSDNQRSFYWYYTGTDVFFAWARPTGGASASRVIKWTNVLTAGEHELELDYDGSIDTNDGLDRAVLKIDAATQGSKSLLFTSGVLTSAINNSTAQLASGAGVASDGSVTTAFYFSGEAKDLIVISGASTEEINIPLIKIGTDTSGNGNDGTWV